MLTMTSTEAAKTFGAIASRVQRDAILVTAHGRPQMVIMAVDEYERLRRLDRRVYSSAELPQDLRHAIAAAEAPAEAARFNHEVEG